MENPGPWLGLDSASNQTQAPNPFLVPFLPGTSHSGLCILNLPVQGEDVGCAEHWKNGYSMDQGLQTQPASS